MIIIILFLLFSSSTICQELNFFREDITFKLDAENFSVEGFYWFLNSSSDKIEKTVFYPLPVKCGSIDEVDVLNISKSLHQNIIRKSERGFNFFISLEPGDTMLYRITYRQKAISDSVLYILRSTRFWGKPLEYAEYKLIVDNKFNITCFSYPPDKTYDIDNKKIYYWKRNNFMPELDMVFHFTKK